MSVSRVICFLVLEVWVILLLSLGGFVDVLEVNFFCRFLNEVILFLMNFRGIIFSLRVGMRVVNFEVYIVLSVFF